MFWKKKRIGSGESDAATPPPEPTTMPDDAFSRLLAEVREDASPLAREAYFRTFWDLIWEMEPWHMLVDPAAPGHGAAPPLLTVQRNGLRHAFVFSSAARAAIAATQLGLRPDEQPRSTVQLSRDHACNTLCATANIDAVTFNPDDPDWLGWLPLRDLAAEYERRFDRLTPRMFGRFGEAVNRGGAPARIRLIRMLLASPEWWFVATEARRQAPSLVATSNGALAVPLFTDGERARRGGSHVVATLHEGEAIALPMTPRDGTSYLRRLHERGRDEIVAVIVNNVPGETGEPAPIPITELLTAADALGY